MSFRRPEFLRLAVAGGLPFATLVAACVVASAPGTASADECPPGMTLGQYGDCIPAVNNEGNPADSEVPAGSGQASDGDAVEPNSPASTCQAPPSCPDGESVIVSDCSCPPR